MNLFKHVSAYLVFGVLTTLVNLGIYKVLLDAGIDYRVSAVAAFILAVAFAYVTNRRWVFESSGDVGRESIRFLLARLASFGVNYGGLIALVELWGADEFLSQIVMNVVVVVLNYILSRFLVFSGGKESEREGRMHHE